MIIHNKMFDKTMQILDHQRLTKNNLFFLNLGAKRVPFFERKLKIDGIIMHYILKK